MQSEQISIFETRNDGLIESEIRNRLSIELMYYLLKMNEIKSNKFQTAV